MAEDIETDKPGIKITLLGQSLGLFLAISFILCVLFDLLVPSMAMHTAWQAFLPGFTWLSLPSFLLGLVESYAYGWYIALVWGSLYNFLKARSAG